MKVAGVEIAGARVAVLGMARSGLGALRLLRNAGAEVTAVDEKPLEALGESVLAAVRATGAAFRRQEPGCTAGHGLVVVSPGVPLEAAGVAEALRAGIPVIGELELASYFLEGPVIAITGSNGKTTTTALTGHILAGCGIACQVGGNIGTPAVAMVGSSRPDQWNVLEVSSFQAETLEHFQARVAVCTNVTPDHLDRHGSMAAYEAAKGRIFTTQASGGRAVLNADDAACERYGSLTAGRVSWFSLRRAVAEGLWLADGAIHCEGGEWMPVAEIPLRGLHNVENVMAAALAAREAGAPLDAIRAAVRAFPGVEHRLEFVRRLAGVDYFNDSKATNVDATLKAVEAFEGGLWIILGGKDKGSDYSPLAGPLKQKARGVLLIGAAAEMIARQLGGAVEMERCGDMASAVAYAAGHASAGDTVLLAPACASFDQFQNFEHRGRVFKDLVGELAGKEQVA